jgi:hypothetical protein
VLVVVRVHAEGSYPQVVEVSTFKLYVKVSVTLEGVHVYAESIGDPRASL